MKIEQAQVAEFMVKAGQDIPDRPTLPSMETRQSRLRWLAEELCELANAWGVEFDLNNRGNTCENFAAWPAPRIQFTDPVEAITEAYDASIDLIVFAAGNGSAMGTYLQPGWDAVYTSNMSKFIDGYRREDGKWMKGPSFRPVNLRVIIENQIAAAAQRDRQAELPANPIPAHDTSLFETSDPSADA